MKKYIIVSFAALLPGCGSGSVTAPAPVGTVVQDVLISSSCAQNNFQHPFYFSQVPSALPSYIVFDFSMPYIDVRYTNQPHLEQGIGLDRYPYTGIDSNYFTGYKETLSNGDTTSYLTDYAEKNLDGTAAQVACINNNLVFSAVVNGHDSIPISTYGGPSITFGYTASKNYYPWASGNLLHFTGNFKQAYQSDPNEVGAQMNIGIFIKNTKTNAKFLYNVNLYNSFGLLKDSINYDPTLKTAYASTSVNANSKYVTSRPNSKSSTVTTTTLFTADGFENHYSFDITKNNLINAFIDSKSSDLINSNPDDWAVYGFFVQSEISQSYNQILATSGTDINLYIEK